jgi:arginine deiminase
MEAVTAPAVGAYSEVGTLRTVIVHRPDLVSSRRAAANSEPSGAAVAVGTA